MQIDRTQKMLWKLTWKKGLKTLKGDTLLKLATRLNESYNSKKLDMLIDDLPKGALGAAFKEDLLLEMTAQLL